MSFKKVFSLYVILLGAPLSAQDSLNFLTPTTNKSAVCWVYNPVFADSEKTSVNALNIALTEDSLSLKGEVAIDSKTRLFKGATAQFNESSEVIEFADGGEVYENNFYLRAESGSVNDATDEFAFENGFLYFQPSNLTVNFNKAQIRNDNQLTFQNASLTTCGASPASWTLSGSEVQIDDATGYGFIKKMRLKIFDRTVFGFPYVPIYPSSTSEGQNIRLSRFLEPSIAYSSDGIDATIPYRFVIDQYNDVVVSPRVIADRGEGLELLWTSSSATNNSSLDLLYLNSDDKFGERFPTHSRAQDSRWAVAYRQSYKLNNTQLQINWIDASDIHVFRDISGEVVNVNFQRVEFLPQSLTLQGQIDKLTYAVDYSGYQSTNPLLTNGYTKSPGVDVIFKDNVQNWQISSQVNFAKFTADSLHDYLGMDVLEGNYLMRLEEVPEGERLFTNSAMQRDYFIGNWQAQTTIGLKTLSYDLHTPTTSISDKEIPYFSTSLTSYFTKPLETGLAILAPSILLGYTKYEDQSNHPIFDTSVIPMGVGTFMQERFSGYDLIADDQFLAVGINYNKYSLGKDVFSLSLKKKFFYKQSQVSFPQFGFGVPGEGPLSSSFSWQSPLPIKISGYLTYNEQHHRVNNASILVDYAYQNVTVGIGKRYRRINSEFAEALDLTEAHLKIPLPQGMGVFMQAQYDNETNELIESEIGFGYENCCVYIGLSATKRTLRRFSDVNSLNNMFLNEAWGNIIDLENKSRINLNFEFKGFNSKKLTVGKRLRNSIFN